MRHLARRAHREKRALTGRLDRPGGGGPRLGNPHGLGRRGGGAGRSFHPRQERADRKASARRSAAEGGRGSRHHGRRKERADSGPHLRQAGRRDRRGCDSRVLLGGRAAPPVAGKEAPDGCRVDRGGGGLAAPLKEGRLQAGFSKSSIGSVGRSSSRGSSSARASLRRRFSRAWTAGSRSASSVRKERRIGCVCSSGSSCMGIRSSVSPGTMSRSAVLRSAILITVLSSDL